MNKKGKWRIIRQHNEFLAYNPKIGNALTFHEDEMEVCKELEGTKICPLKKEQREANCEIRTFFNETNCQEGVPFASNIFTLFLKPDNLYIFPRKRTTISIKRWETFTFTVNYNVFIKIPQNCSIIVGKEEFKASETKMNTTIFSPSMNLTQLKFEDLKDSFDESSLTKIASHTITKLDELLKRNADYVPEVEISTGSVDGTDMSGYLIIFYIIGIIFCIRMIAMILEMLLMRHRQTAV